MNAEITVELAFSPRGGVVDLQSLRLPAGSRVVDALRAGGLEAAATEHATGIWGRLCAQDQTLREGDRVELYRPLLIDPKDARRNRQRQQGKRSGGAGLSGNLR